MVANDRCKLIITPQPDLVPHNCCYTELNAPFVDLMMSSFFPNNRLRMSSKTSLPRLVTHQECWIAKFTLLDGRILPNPLLLVAKMVILFFKKNSSSPPPINSNIVSFCISDLPLGAHIIYLIILSPHTPLNSSFYLIFSFFNPDQIPNKIQTKSKQKSFK